MTVSPLCLATKIIRTRMNTFFVYCNTICILQTYIQKYVYIAIYFCSFRILLLMQCNNVCPRKKKIVVKKITQICSVISEISPNKLYLCSSRIDVIVFYFVNILCTTAINIGLDGACRCFRHFQVLNKHVWSRPDQCLLQCCKRY